MSFFLQLSTKEDTLKNVVDQTLTVAIDFNSMEKKKIYKWKSVGTNNCFQNIFFVQQKTEFHTGLEQLEGELTMTIFIFGF